MKAQMRWGAAGLVLAAAAFALAGCSGGNDASKSMDLSAKDSGRTVQVHTADVLVVRLESNASTGFRWMLTGKPDAKVLELVGSDYVAPTTSLLGAPGQEVWRFRAVGQGSTSLELRYQRASGETAGEPFHVTVEVTSGR